LQDESFNKKPNSAKRPKEDQTVVQKLEKELNVCGIAITLSQEISILHEHHLTNFCSYLHRNVGVLTNNRT